MAKQLPASNESFGSGVSGTAISPEAQDHDPIHFGGSLQPEQAHRPWQPPLFPVSSKGGAEFLGQGAAGVVGRRQREPDQSGARLQWPGAVGQPLQTAATVFARL